MSEKRFTWKIVKLQHLDDEVIMVVDNENKEWKGHILNIVDLLNEQQSLITALEKEHKRQQNQIKLLNKQLSKIPPKIREVWLYD